MAAGDPDNAADTEGEWLVVAKAVEAADGAVDCEVAPVREADAVRHSEGVLLTERVALSGEPLLLAHAVTEEVGMALVGVAEPQNGAEAVGAPPEPLGVIDAEPEADEVCVKMVLPDDAGLALGLAVAPVPVAETRAAVPDSSKDGVAAAEALPCALLDGAPEAVAKEVPLGLAERGAVTELWGD